MPLCSADSGSLRGAVMNGDIEATGASALMTSHMSGRMISQIAVVGGRRRWSMDQKLEILREAFRSEEHTSELQSLMRISYAVFCLKKKKKTQNKSKNTNK